MIIHFSLFLWNNIYHAAIFLLFSHQDDDDDDDKVPDYGNYYILYILAVNEDRDTALLSLMKSFTQSAEMAILQTYIMAISSNSFNPPIGKLFKYFYN